MIELICNSERVTWHNDWKTIGSEHRARHTYGKQYTYNKERQTQKKYPINIITKEVLGD